MPRNKRAVAAPDDEPFEGSIAASVSEAPASPPLPSSKKRKVQNGNEASPESMHYSMEGDLSSLSVLTLTSASTEAARAAKLEAKAENAKAAREQERQDFFDVPPGQLRPETKQDLVLRLKAMGGTETSKEIAASCEDKRVTEKSLSKWKIQLQDERAKVKAEGGNAEEAVLKNKGRQPVFSKGFIADLADLVVRKAEEGEVIRRKQKRGLLGLDGAALKEIGNLDSMLAEEVSGASRRSRMRAKSTVRKLAGVEPDKKGKKIQTTTQDRDEAERESRNLAANAAASFVSQHDVVTGEAVHSSCICVMDPVKLQAGNKGEDIQGEVPAGIHVPRTKAQGNEAALVHYPISLSVNPPIFFDGSTGVIYIIVKLPLKEAFKIPKSSTDLSYEDFMKSFEPRRLDIKLPGVHPQPLSYSRLLIIPQFPKKSKTFGTRNLFRYMWEMEWKHMVLDRYQALSVLAQELGENFAPGPRRFVWKGDGEAPIVAFFKDLIEDGTMEELDFWVILLFFSFCYIIFILSFLHSLKSFLPKSLLFRKPLPLVTATRPPMSFCWTRVPQESASLT